jgi:hypothetical protein
VDGSLGEVAFAMLALQHEATHIALNSGDESLVECTAILNRSPLVRLFKLAARIARKIMEDDPRDDHAARV